MNGPSASPETPYAGAITRALAFALDMLVVNVSLAAVAAIVGLILSAFDENLSLGVGAVLTSAVAWLVITGLYLISFWVVVGQTPGMRWMGIALERADGGNLHVGRAIVRAIALPIAAIPLFWGYLPVLFDRRRRAVPDILAGSVVLYREPAEETHGL